MPARRLNAGSSRIAAPAARTPRHALCEPLEVLPLHLCRLVHAPWFQCADVSERNASLDSIQASPAADMAVRTAEEKGVAGSAAAQAPGRWQNRANLVDAQQIAESDIRPEGSLPDHDQVNRVSSSRPNKSSVGPFGRSLSRSQGKRSPARGALSGRPASVSDRALSR